MRKADAEDGTLVVHKERQQQTQCLNCRVLNKIDDDNYLHQGSESWWIFWMHKVDGLIWRRTTQQRFITKSTVQNWQNELLNAKSRAPGRPGLLNQEFSRLLNTKIWQIAIEDSSTPNTNQRVRGGGIGLINTLNQTQRVFRKVDNNK